MQLKKSPKASLEDKKLTYILLGLAFTLSICYVALEWTEKEVTKYEVADLDMSFEEEVEIQQTQQDVTPPPPPPQIQEVEVLNVVEDEKEVEDIEIQTEDDKEEEVVFMVVEKMPEFPGGQQALFKYLSENVKYPVIAQENGIQGRVICQFTVNKDGSIVDVEVVRSGGDPSLDKEAVRVIKSMPKWKAGQQRGKPVRVKYTVPVSFRLQ